MTLRRRDFLKSGGLAALGLGLNLTAPWPIRQRLLAEDTGLIAGAADSSKKLIYIFLRGGNDSLNTLIPQGDAQYNAQNRPTLYISPDDSLDLGNGFARLHPRMAPLMEVYGSQALTGTDGLGNVALIHATGYAGHSQSHFNSQHYFETGKPEDLSLEEGMLYRHVAATMNPDENRFVAAAIDASQMVAFKGRIPLPNLRDTESFRLSGTAAKASKFLGRLGEGGEAGSGLLGTYGGERDFAGKPYRDLVFGTGLALGDAMAIVQNAVDQGPYVPENGAVYPNSSLGDKLQEIAMLTKRTPLRVAGADTGGFDTHTSQGAILGSHGNLLENVAECIRALARDLESQWDDLAIVVITEFARTSRENGSRGTDHAKAGLTIVAGGGVRGGVYNCDASTWPDGYMFSNDSRYVQYRTDYRAIFAEIFRRHFGDSQAIVDQVIPEYAAESARRPNEFRFLNFLG